MESNAEMIQSQDLFNPVDMFRQVCSIEEFDLITPQYLLENDYLERDTISMGICNVKVWLSDICIHQNISSY